MPDRDEPFYEPAIRRHFPSWAASRAESRAKNEYFAAVRGGIPTRTGNPYPTTRTVKGGTSLQRLNAKQMCDRGRKVFKQSAVGRSLLTTETNNVIADGMTAQPATREDDFNKEAKEKFPAWFEEADIRGMLNGADLQAQMYRNPRCDGDGGVVMMSLPGGVSRLQYIPRDLIRNPDGKTTTPNMIDGVEVNEFSAPVAFHVMSDDGMGKRDFRRIPREDFIFLTPTIGDDPLCVRSDSCYAQSFDELDQLDGFKESVNIAARMAAVFGLIFKEKAAATQFDRLPTALAGDGTYQKALSIDGSGMTRWIHPEADVVQVDAKQPMQHTSEHIRMMCRMVGLPFDMPLELVLRDSSQGSFANTRLALTGYYRACWARQEWFIKRCLSRIYRWWIEREVTLRRFVSKVPSNFAAHRFLPVPWDYMDPITDPQSDQLQIDMGIKTPEMVAEERGRNHTEMQIRNAAIRAENRLLKLPDIRSTYTRDPVVSVDGGGQPPKPVPTPTE